MMGRKLVQLFVKKSHYRNPTWETVMWQPNHRIEGEKRLRWVHLWWFIAHQLPSLIPHNLHSQPPHLFAQEWESFRIQWTRTWTDRNWENVMMFMWKGLKFSSRNRFSHMLRRSIEMHRALGTRWYAVSDLMRGWIEGYCKFRFPLFELTIQQHIIVPSA